IYWVEECSTATGYGAFAFDITIAVNPGYEVKVYIEQEIAGVGSYSTSLSMIATDYMYRAEETGMPLPLNAAMSLQYDVYAPTGVLVSSTMFSASCITGEVWTSYGDVYGINEPAANARVLGTVLADTPVYSEASPTAALKPVLKAGQTWFIVGQTTGTDGALWYKVFVGSANYGYVPASTMTPQGPVPGAK
ncbi:MAG TPA: hypothetical protein VHP83_03815, partial [Aggregatilineaceae bacterium]|nr:hypothetical protein [Aggregatilineaceae bacterium]